MGIKSFGEIQIEFSHPFFQGHFHLKPLHFWHPLSECAYPPAWWVFGALFVSCSPSHFCERALFLWSSVWALVLFPPSCCPRFGHISAFLPGYFWEVEAVSWCRKPSCWINSDPASGMNLRIFLRQHQYHNLHFQTLGECWKQLRPIRWDGFLSSLPSLTLFSALFPPSLKKKGKGKQNNLYG